MPRRNEREYQESSLDFFAALSVSPWRKLMNRHCERREAIQSFYDAVFEINGNLTGLLRHYDPRNDEAHGSPQPRTEAIPMSSDSSSNLTFLQHSPLPGTAQTRGNQFSADTTTCKHHLEALAHLAGQHQALEFASQS